MSAHWLVTWTTYGTWLPGDTRGFRTWHGREHVPPPERYASPDEPSYESKPYTTRLESARRMMAQSIQLSTEQMRAALDAVVSDVNFLPIAPQIMAVDATHVHLLAEFGPIEIRPTVARLKSVATRAMGGRAQSSKRFWSSGCHMRSLSDEAAVSKAYLYVERHADHGGLIHTWISKPAAPPPGISHNKPR